MADEHPYYSKYMEEVSTRAAKKAVHDIFDILGVNVDDPKEVEDFRRDIRFTGDLRKFYGRGMLGFATVFAGFFASALWIGIQSMIGKGVK